MKILLIDNYDSFTFNLYHYLSKYSQVDVIRNDKINSGEIVKRKYNKIVISPGPGDITILLYFFLMISLSVISSFLNTSTFVFNDDK